MSRRNWALGFKIFWIALTLCSIYVLLFSLLSYVLLQCQEEIEHWDWNSSPSPIPLTLCSIDVSLSLLTTIYSMSLSNVKKKLSTGIGIFLDSPKPLLNSIIICLSPMSRRNWALRLESFWIPPTLCSIYVLPFHYYHRSLSNVKKKLSTGIWTLLDSPNSLPNLCSLLITTELSNEACQNTWLPKTHVAQQL